VAQILNLVFSSSAVRDEVRLCKNLSEPALSDEWPDGRARGEEGVLIIKQKQKNKGEDNKSTSQRAPVQLHLPVVLVEAKACAYSSLTLHCTPR